SMEICWRADGTEAGRHRQCCPVLLLPWPSRSLPASLGQGALEQIGLERFEPAAAAVIATAELDLCRPAEIAFGGVAIPSPDRHQCDAEFFCDDGIGNERLNFSITHMGSCWLEPSDTDARFTLGEKRGGQRTRQFGCS